MTNKMKLIFVIVTVVSTAFLVLLTPFAVDIADQVLTATSNSLALYNTPIPSVLVWLIIPGLYVAYRQRKHL
ncbi:MAG TPA: hypothetical protein VHO84_14350 [Syntrophorhabdaceae bacterium]|nr:hypothetical protein [Syntrophorhabdaceae bacterium]